LSAPTAAFQVFITWLARAAFSVGLVLVTVLSLMPATGLPSTDISDKIEHFLGYFALAAAGAAGFHGPRDRLVMILGLITFGILMEFGQMVSPGRDPSIGDAIANALGVLCGAMVGSLGVLALDALRPLLKAP
jgi:VanZ family protein